MQEVLTVDLNEDVAERWLLEYTHGLDCKPFATAKVYGSFFDFSKIEFYDSKRRFVKIVRRTSDGKLFQAIV